MTIIISNITDTYDLRPDILWVKDLDAFKLFEKEQPSKFIEIIKSNPNIIKHRF